MKMILNDVKILTEYKLKTNPTCTTIFKSVCFDILDIIDKSTTKEISVKQFESQCKKSWELIERHILWLIDNKIIWRSKLTYNVDSVEKNIPLYNVYRYDIHNQVNITNFDRFVYTTVNSLECNTTTTTVDNELRLLLNSLNKLDIKLMDSLEYIYNSTKEQKRKLSRLCYNIALKEHTIGYGKNVKRVFHTVTSIPKDLHKFLYINNKQVMIIDAKQSQLTLISNLTRDVDSEFHNIIDNGYFYNDLINYFKDELSYNESISDEKDAGYLCYWKNDEKDGEKYKKIHWSEINKDEHIKPLVYASLFSGFTNNSPVTTYMKERYENVLVSFTAKVKQAGYRSPAAFLQDLEAMIFISAAIELIYNNIDVITKHDSLMFNPDNYEIVKATLDRYYKLNNINFFKIETEQEGGLQHSLFEKPNVDVINDNSDHSSIQKQIDHSSIQKQIGNTDLTVYTFIHSSGESFTGIKSVFIKSFNLDRKSVNKVISGIVKQTKGWSIG